MKIGRWAGRFLRDTSGATAVEFALVLGPLILLVIGSIEVGRLLWSGHGLNEAAIAGARCIGIHAPDCADAEVVVDSQAVAFVTAHARSWGLVLAPEDISLATNAGCAVDTGFLRVAISFEFVSVLPGLSGTELESEACFPSQF